MRLSRREFIKLTSAGAVALSLPAVLEACGSSKSAPFFTEHERATVQAATARLLPTDQDPGAIEAQAVNYIENLLSAFDHDPPLIFAGGPYSGRQPFPDAVAGKPSTDFPKNNFERFLPLSRTKEIAWRMRVLGSASTPGGNFNDAVLGPTKGWRDVYREGLAALDAKSHELSNKDFVVLGPDDQDKAIEAIDQAFVITMLTHTLEGAYAAPEYGGNAGLVMWAALKYEGDSHPLGYSIYNETTKQYNELDNRPLSKPNPDEDFAGIDSETADFITGLVTGVGGQRFF